MLMSRARGTLRRVDSPLFDAYRRTAFIAETPTGKLRLRIGQRSQELDMLLEAAGVATWAYVTACNPGSTLFSDEENEARQRELTRIVVARGFVAYGGEGIGDDGAWPAEPSLLILGTTRREAIELGRRFGQVAV